MWENGFDEPPHPHPDLRRGKNSDRLASCTRHNLLDPIADGGDEPILGLRGQCQKRAAITALEMSVDQILDLGVERDDPDRVAAIFIHLADGSCQCVSGVFDEDVGVFGSGRPFSEGFEDGFEVSDGDAFSEESLEDALEVSDLDDFGDDVVDGLGGLGG